MNATKPYITIVIPCLNEQRTIGTCIRKASEVLREMAVPAEILVADNGSSDDSERLARQHGARVVRAPVRGNGNALRAGFRAANGRYLIMFDADDSYDISSIPTFLAYLEQGYDLVIGNRFLGGIRPGAMPWSHRYFGNPLLSMIYKLLFRGKIGDINSGIRGIRRESLGKWDLRTSGMEFCAEMVVMATIRNMKIAEVPTVLFPDGRGRPSHLKTWRDGWRIFIFMLRIAVERKWLKKI
mgnify:CR=1 FL=1